MVIKAQKALLTVRTFPFGSTQLYSIPARTQPTNYSSGIANYQRIVRNISSDYRTCADKTIGPNRMSTDYGSVGSNGGPLTKV
jgi:hypothetical protein